MSFLTVGTLITEIFRNDRYGEEVDWWSIYLMFIKMVLLNFCEKNVKWKKYFQIPDDV